MFSNKSDRSRSNSLPNAEISKISGNVKRFSSCDIIDGLEKEVSPRSVLKHKFYNEKIIPEVNKAAASEIVSVPSTSPI